MIVTRFDGSKWADRCDLCKGSRKLEGSGLRGERDFPCPWCRAVKYKHGDYFYPINDSNKHLFENKPEPEPVWKQYVREEIAKEIAEIKKSLETPEDNKYYFVYGNLKDMKAMIDLLEKNRD